MELFMFLPILNNAAMITSVHYLRCGFIIPLETVLIYISSYYSSLWEIFPRYFCIFAFLVNLKIVYLVPFL